VLTHEGLLKLWGGNELTVLPTDVLGILSGMWTQWMDSFLQQLVMIAPKKHDTYWGHTGTIHLPTGAGFLPSTVCLSYSFKCNLPCSWWLIFICIEVPTRQVSYPKLFILLTIFGSIWRGWYNIVIYKQYQSRPRAWIKLPKVICFVKSN
jgi:hypothetical protein